MASVCSDSCTATLNGRTRLDVGKHDLESSWFCGELLDDNLELPWKRRRVEHGNHGVLEIDLRPELWAALPDALVEEILGKLPLSSLLRLCSVCKRWRDLILSSCISPRCTSHLAHLFLFFNHELSVFNSSRGTWESVPLQFLQTRFTLLDVVSSAGGLLCFNTTVVGEYIVCNPLTKSFRRLQLPFSAAADQPCMPTPTIRGDHVVRTLLVVMVALSDAGHFKLIVAGLFPWSRATTLVYDSHANLWKKTADVPGAISENSPLSTASVRVVCGGNLYVYFRYGRSIKKTLFKYDVERQEWSSILLPQFRGRLQSITECNGKVLLVTSHDECSSGKSLLLRFLVFELQETRSKLWLPTNSLPICKLREPVADMLQSKFLGGGGVLFYIRGSSHKPSGPGTYSVKISVREWFHNIPTNSYSGFISKWEEFETGFFFPDFQIFRPSMLGLK